MKSNSPFMEALIHPLNVFMLVASVIGGLVSAWWLFPVGLLFWLIMFIAVTRDPALRIDHARLSRAPLAQRFQPYFDRIERSQISIFNSLSSASNRMRKTLHPIQSEIDSLIAETHKLCERMTSLENYRQVSQSQSDLQADLKQITAMIESTEDNTVRQEYIASRHALEERISKLDAVATQLDRVEAQLLSMASEMDSVVTEVIRLQAMGPQDAAKLVPEVVQKLRQESAELSDFQKEAIRI